MDSPNFQFLQRHHPELSKLGASAEGYVYSDPQSAVVKLRCFAEIYVGFIYEELSLPTYGVKTFFEQLDNASFMNAVEQCVVEKLHLIRMKGNKAAHPGGVSIDDAIGLVKEAYFLGAWIYMSYHGGKIDELPQYHEPQPIKPEDEALKKDKQRLQQALDLQTVDLEKAKVELAEAQQDQRETKEKLEAINAEVNQVRLAEVQKAGQEAVASYDFELEKTRRNISLEDAFAEYELTEGQSTLLNNLAGFLASRNDKVFLLKGYAGTGKTFITKGLTEYFRAIDRNYILAAPTGKASKVIASKTRSPAYTIHKTIYSFKDIVEYKESDIDGSETYKFYSQLAVNEQSVDTVYIVDEASMVSDIYSEAEFFRFGSGHLLRDFLKYVNLDHNDHRKKIIFIGDDAQLPPVGMKFSPALDSRYLAKEYGLETFSYELTEVVRQKADSGVMRNTVAMRKALKDNIFNQLDFDLAYPDIAHIEHSDLIARYLESCGGKINAESIVIAHSNADVAAYNRRIREEFFPGMPEVCAGDKVMAVTNSDTQGFFISNGDFGQVRQVCGEAEQRSIPIWRKSPETGEGEKIKVPLQFRDVVVGFRDLDGGIHFFSTKVVENLLYSDAPTLSSDENKALYIDFLIRNKNIKRGSLEFKETLRSDPYFNALRLKFGYAITCHKAQGSEWQHVFVKCKTHQSQLCAAYFRWLYTAITRTANKLYLLDEPHIKLGGDIEVVSNPGTVASKKAVSQPTPSSRKSELPTQISDSRGNSATGLAENTFGIPAANGFLIHLLSEVKRCIESVGVEIYDIHHQQYQEAYLFSRGPDSCRINFSYNGKHKITAVLTPQSSELGSELLDLLGSLKGRLLTPTATSPAGSTFQFDESFLNDFHERLLCCASKAGIDITDVVQQPYAQRYFFEKAGECVAVDIFYNKKKQFRKCEPVGNLHSSGTLLNDVLLLITEGLS